MLNEYRLKFFNSFLYRLFDLNKGIFLNSTDSEYDLDEFNYEYIEKGMIVALAMYIDDKLAIADAVILSEIKKDEGKVYLSNGLCFNKNGELIDPKNYNI